MLVKELVSTSTEALLSFIAVSICTADSSSISTVSRTWLQLRSGMWRSYPRLAWLSVIFLPLLAAEL